MNDLQDKDLSKLSKLLDNLEKAKRDKMESQVIMDKLVEFFRETGLKSYKTSELIIRFVDERKTVQFDAELLQSKYPEIWKECHTEHIRKPHLSIKKISEEE